MLKVRFIVLHRYPYSESSYVVKALGEGVGVVSFLVKGARRKESPFRVAMDPFACCEVVYKSGAMGALQIPREAQLIEYFSKIRSNLEALAQVQVMCELMLRFSQIDGQLHDEFEVLLQAMLNLENQNSTEEGNWVLANFLKSLSDLMGLKLQLDACVECSAPLSKVVDLWPARGGGACSNCVGEFNPHYKQPFIRVLGEFIRGSAPISADYSAIEVFYLDYLRIHLGANLHLKSYEWLLQLRKSAV